MGKFDNNPDYLAIFSIIKEIPFSFSSIISKLQYNMHQMKFQTISEFLALWYNLAISFSSEL